MRMRTCRQCRRRRPYKKLRLGNSSSSTKIVQCSDTVSCSTAAKKLVVEPPVTVVFIDDVLPLMTREVHQALYLLLQHKFK